MIRPHDSDDSATVIFYLLSASDGYNWPASRTPPLTITQIFRRLATVSRQKLD